MARHRVRHSVALGIALLLVIAGCASSASSDSEAPTPTRPPAAAVDIQLDLVDPTRPAKDPVGERSAPERVLPTTLRIPAASKPVPLIVFAHGYDGDPTKFTELFQHWVDAGFAVLAPRFPITATGASGGPLSRAGDVTEQPADLTFVLDELLRSKWKSRIDRARIGAAGLSLGGATIWSYVADTCCRDRRIKAAIVMDGIRIGHPDGTTIPNRIPLLIYHADHDYSLSFTAAQDAYAASAPPKYFVTIFGAFHAEPYENSPNPADSMVADSSTTFWRAYLLDDGAVRTNIVAAGTVPGVSTAEADPGG